MTKTDVAVVDEEQALALAESEAAAAEIAAAQDEEYGDDTMSTPILKVGQALTREVQEGDATAGEFINTLTNEGLGDKVQFIVSFYNKGRFASDKKTDRAYVSFDSTIPANWEPLVGAEFVGTAFAEYPEAEETFKAAVNSNEREWGHGPLVSTTHNFTGYVLADGEEEEIDYQPVRLSLKRTDVPAARKINTIHRMSRNKPTWDVVLGLSTTKKEFGKNAAFVINPSDVKIVRKTTVEEKTLGSQLALAVAGGRTRTTGDIEDAPVEPDAGGGLAV